MRLHVTLNNEDGARSAYSHDPYTPNSGVQQPQLFHLQNPNAMHTAPPVQHFAPQYGSGIVCHAENSTTSTPPNMPMVPGQQPYISPSLASNTASSHSFYASSSDSENGEDRNSVQSHNTGYSASCNKLRPMGTVPAERGRMDPSRYKTQQCARGENCPYRPNCAFAHGETEKRSRRRNVREGVTKVNTLPRAIVFHEAWVQTTKYTCKTGPSEAIRGPAGFMPATAAPTPAVPAPSFKKA